MLAGAGALGGNEIRHPGRRHVDVAVQVTGLRVFPAAARTAAHALAEGEFARRALLVTLALAAAFLGQAMLGAGGVVALVVRGIGNPTRADGGRAVAGMAAVAGAVATRVAGGHRGGRTVLAGTGGGFFRLTGLRFGHGISPCCGLLTLN